MPTQTKSKLPAPFYAAAGAGDFVYQRLRQVEFDKVSEFAQAAQRKAVDLYFEFVARGEKVVAGGRSAKNGHHSPAAVEENSNGKKATRPSTSTNHK